MIVRERTRQKLLAAAPSWCEYQKSETAKWKAHLKHVGDFDAAYATFSFTKPPVRGLLNLGRPTSHPVLLLVGGWKDRDRALCEIARENGAEFTRNSCTDAPWVWVTVLTRTPERVSAEVERMSGFTRSAFGTAAGAGPATWTKW